jgi:hypothetical protein
VPAKTAIEPAGTSGSGSNAGPQLQVVSTLRVTTAEVAATVANAVANANADAVAAVQPKPETEVAAAASQYAVDLYDARAERWQNPDNTACTAASTLSMLNTIAYAGAPAGFVWTATTAYATQEGILGYERTHMTMTTVSPGTDPHGWRDALNFYGWGSIHAGVYADESFSSFSAAAIGAVSALATTRKPVGILALNGGHAQFITGYKVTGADPATGSTDFTVVGIYLTDPWKAAGHRDTYVAYAQWQTGGKWLRFSQYAQTDSPRRDAIDGQVGKREWYGKWVIIAPVK